MRPFSDGVTIDDTPFAAAVVPVGWVRKSATMRPPTTSAAKDQNLAMGFSFRAAIPFPAPLVGTFPTDPSALPAGSDTGVLGREFVTFDAMGLRFLRGCECLAAQNILSPGDGFNMIRLDARPIATEMIKS